MRASSPRRLAAWSASAARLAGPSRDRLRHVAILPWAGKPEIKWAIDEIIESLP